MSPLFTLYRYLVQNQDDNAYNVALRALEPVLDMLKKLEMYGDPECPPDDDDAQTIKDIIISGHETALLIAHYGDIAATFVDFAKSHVRLEQYEAVITALQEQYETEKKEKEIEEEGLGDLDAHPF